MPQLDEESQVALEAGPPPEPEETAPAPDDPEKQRAALAAADEKAKTLAVAARPDDPSQSCPLKARFAIEVAVIGADDKPVADVAVELLDDKGGAQLAKSDATGSARFEGLMMNGAYKLCLYDLDKEAWKVEQAESLPADRAKSGAAEVGWGSPGKPSDVPASVKVEEGECVSKLAARYGYLPDALWKAQSDDLRSKRPSKNILAPGDSITLPAKARREVPAEAGKRYVVRRLGMPDVARLRFLDLEGKPRKGLAYLVSLGTGDEVEERKGTTNGDGFLVEPVSPAITRLKVTIGPKDAREVYDFMVAALDPLDTPSGVRQRLDSLGYPSDDDPKGILPPIQVAIRDFQEANGLKKTGEINDETRKKLQELYGS
jgi:hypothetical protein